MQLTLRKREIFGKKLASERRAGHLPVVIYGHKHKSTPYFVDLKEFKKIWHRAGESTLVSLKEGAKTHDVLIQEVATHPLSGEPIHVDFYAIEADKPVEVKVALEFTGTSAAVKIGGALLVKVLHEVEISVLPKHLPHSLPVDLSKLDKIGDQIRVKDIVLPLSAVLKTQPDEIIVIATMPKEEKEEEATPVDLSAIEVEKKGKEVKEGEEEEMEAPGKEKPAKPEKKTEKK